MATSSQLDRNDSLEMVVVSRDSDPTIEEMMEYWRKIRNLRRCDGCSHHIICWRVDGIAYFPKAILHVCPKKNVSEAVLRMQEMKKDKPLGYYAISGKWLIFRELNTLLED